MYGKCKVILKLEYGEGSYGFLASLDEIDHSELFNEKKNIICMHGKGAFFLSEPSQSHTTFGMDLDHLRDLSNPGQCSSGT